MTDRARTVADTEKNSTMDRVSVPQAPTTAGKEVNLTPVVDESTIPHGPYSTLMASPTTQTRATMAEIENYALCSGLQIGDVLPTEPRLYTDLEISRSSIREAVYALVALGVVEVRYGHGTSVDQISTRPMVEFLILKSLFNPGDDHRGLRDIVEVRIILDSALVGPVAHAWYNCHDPELNTLIDNTEHLASQGKLSTDQDHCFHTRLLQPLDSHLYLHLTKAFWAVCALTVSLLDAPRLEDFISTAKAHRAMLRAAHVGSTPAYHKAIIDYYAPLLAVLT